MDNAISILSGGLDSAVSTAIAMQHHTVVKAITFDYGQRSAKAEIKASKKLCSDWNIDHDVIDLKLLGSIGKSALTSKDRSLPHISKEEIETDTFATLASAEQVWVPNRNAIFINIAAAMAEAENFQWILTGFNNEEAQTFPDNSAQFIEIINNCLAQSTLSHPQVISYVKEMDKIDIVKNALDLKVNIGDIWCCYDDKEKWCGECESCSRLIRALEKTNTLKKFKSNFLKI